MGHIPAETWEGTLLGHANLLCSAHCSSVEGLGHSTAEDPAADDRVYLRA